MKSPPKNKQLFPDDYDADDDDYYPSPEDFNEKPERPKGPLSQFPSPRHALPALFLFFIFYISTVIYTGYPQGEYLWLSGDALFSRHEYWRLATSLFTHADLLHIISNALIFLAFGWMLKAYFGFIAFPGLTLIIGLATNLITIALYDPGIQLIGASGMAYGMVSLWLVLYIQHDTDHSVPVRIMRSVGFALAMMFPTTFDPHVSYLAHATGFGMGLVVGILLLPVIRLRDPK
jgi:membrane associated rhomboid family serine protease